MCTRLASRLCVLYVLFYVLYFGFWFRACIWSVCGRQYGGVAAIHFQLLSSSLTLSSCVTSIHTECASTSQAIQCQHTTVWREYEGLCINMKTGVTFQCLLPSPAPPLYHGWGLPLHHRANWDRVLQRFTTCSHFKIKPWPIQCLAPLVFIPYATPARVPCGNTYIFHHLIDVVHCACIPMKIYVLRQHELLSWSPPFQYICFRCEICTMPQWNTAHCTLRLDNRCDPHRWHGRWKASWRMQLEHHSGVLSEVSLPGQWRQTARDAGTGCITTGTPQHDSTHSML